MLLAVALSVHGQGTFQNLDFESANLAPIAAGQLGVEVPIASALPGWSASFGRKNNGVTSQHINIGNSKC
jgi:hypothetical protein